MTHDKYNMEKGYNVNSVPCDAFLLTNVVKSDNLSDFIFCVIITVWSFSSDLSQQFNSVCQKNHT